MLPLFDQKSWYGWIYFTNSPLAPAVSGGGEQSSKRRKRYKRVTITVITQHTGDTDSEGETPPPPPPGSPTRSVWQSVSYSLEMM